MAYAKDLVNMKFGRLFVISRNYNKQKELFNSKGVYKAFWNCQCDCGNFVTITSSSLLNKSNPTLSCGCLAKERQHCQKNTKKNQWIFKDKVAIGRDFNGNEFFVDIDDYEKVKDFCWRVDKRGYVVSNSRNGKNKTIFIHRIIMNVPDDLFVDHKNWDKSNNRKENLRVATKSQNNTNIKRKTNNTSGYPGVTKTKNNHYVSRISSCGKRYYLGTYKNFEDAVVARRNAEIKIHKDWSGENNKHDYEKLIKLDKKED